MLRRRYASLLCVTPRGVVCQPLSWGHGTRNRILAVGSSVGRGIRRFPIPGSRSGFAGERLPFPGADGAAVCGADGGLVHRLRAGGAGPGGRMGDGADTVDLGSGGLVCSRGRLSSALRLHARSVRTGVDGDSGRQSPACRLGPGDRPWAADRAGRPGIVHRCRRPGHAGPRDCDSGFAPIGAIAVSQCSIWSRPIFERAWICTCRPKRC